MGSRFDGDEAILGASPSHGIGRSTIGRTEIFVAAGGSEVNRTVPRGSRSNRSSPVGKSRLKRGGIVPTRLRQTRLSQAHAVAGLTTDGIVRRDDAAHMEWANERF